MSSFEDFLGCLRFYTFFTFLRKKIFLVYCNNMVLPVSCFSSTGHGSYERTILCPMVITYDSATGIQI